MALGKKNVSPPTPAFNDLHAFNYKDDSVSCFIFTAAHIFPSGILSFRKAVGTKPRNFLRVNGLLPWLKDAQWEFWCPWGLGTPLPLTPLVFVLGCPLWAEGYNFFKLKDPWNSVQLMLNTSKSESHAMERCVYLRRGSLWSLKSLLWKMPGNLFLTVCVFVTCLQTFYRLAEVKKCFWAPLTPIWLLVYFNWEVSSADQDFEM